MKKHLTVWRIVCYLIYFLGVCTLVLGVTNARYLTTVTGTGTASVAVAVLDTTALTGEGGAAEIDLTNTITGLQPGAERNVTFEVANFKDQAVSEVTQEYSVIVNTTGNLPLDYTLAGTAEGTGGNGQKGSVAALPSQNPGGTVLQWTGGSFPHSIKCTHKYTLTISWPKEKDDAEYAGKIDLVNLTIDAKQAGTANIN